MNNYSRPCTLKLILCAVFATVVSSAASHAASQSWGANANYNWNATTANWSNSVWVNNNDALFGSAGVGTVTVSTGVSANSLTFNTAGYTITGAALTLTGSADITTNTDAAISSNIVGSAGLVKDGAGTLTLNGANNTFSGATTVNAGTLVVTAGAALYPNTSVVINAGGTLQLANGNTIYNEPIQINGGALQVTGGGGQNFANIAFTNGGSISTPGGGSWFNAEFELNGSVTVNSGTATIAATHGIHANSNPVFNVSSGAQLKVSADLQDTYDGQARGISKTGAGLLVLNSASAYTGTTTVAAGTLSADSDKALGNSSNVIVNGGTLSLHGTTPASTVTIGGGGNFTLTSGTVKMQLGTTFDQLVGSGAGTLAISGGTLALDVTGVGFSYTDAYEIFSGFGGGISVSGLAITGYDTAHWVATLDDSIFPGYLYFTAVPEPSTWAMLLGGLGMLAMFRRRTRAKTTLS
jgi:autotransporter-associated beta strand protein